MRLSTSLLFPPPAAPPLSFSLPPCVPFFRGLTLSFFLCLFLSLSLGTLYPPAGGPTFPRLSEFGHRTTLDEFPTSPRRVPVPPARDRRFTRPRESVGERVIKAPLRQGGEMGRARGAEARLPRVVPLLATSVFSSPSSPRPRRFRVPSASHPRRLLAVFSLLFVQAVFPTTVSPRNFSDRCPRELSQARVLLARSAGVSDAASARYRDSFPAIPRSFFL